MHHRTTLLKLTLVIIMIVQPVMFSYAMADVNHNHHTMIVLNQDHKHHNMPSGHHNHGDHQQSDDADSSNCCASPACSSAAVSTIFLNSSPIPSVYISDINMYGKSIMLFAEVKPPRHNSTFTA